MEELPRHEVTRLLQQWRRGDSAALEALIPLVEAELRRLAGGYMRNERAGHTLQPTALINEAWLRIAQQNQPVWESRSHFIAIAAQYMRQVLVDYARRKTAQKRAALPVEVKAGDLEAPEPPIDLVALDDGLRDLTRLDGRQAHIVELHFFGGLTYEEIAEYLHIGRSTVIRDLRMAQVWLRSYIAEPS
jgi:RNA polymerase sigma-70 factor, ECF subfamily